MSDQNLSLTTTGCRSSFTFQSLPWLSGCTYMPPLSCPGPQGTQHPALHPPPSLKRLFALENLLLSVFDCDSLCGKFYGGLACHTQESSDCFWQEVLFLNVLRLGEARLMKWFLTKLWFVWLFCFVLFFWERFSLCSFGHLGTQAVD